MPSEFLDLEILETAEIKIEDGFEHRNKPFAASKVFVCTIEDFTPISFGDDVKEIIEIEFSSQGMACYEFTPGDSVAILPRNCPNEVDALIELLDLQDMCDKVYKLHILEGTKKKNAAIPKHLPPIGTVRDLFTKYIDIRIPPKKLFLKLLLKYTTDPEEHAQLELISSPKATKEYNKFIEENIGLVELFKTFSSCRPPLEAILEHSSPLQPRYYSIASYPLKESFKILFDVVEYKGRKGICTGWLKNCITTKEVPIYFRTPTNFRYEATRPTLLVATGTGIAPFISFLDYKENNESSELGDIWLYYGCRYKDRDNLCKDFGRFLSNGCLNKLTIAHSREGEKCYVQDKIKNEARELVDFVENDGKIYVCGSRSMEKDVRETIIECFRISKNIDRQESENIFNSFLKENRYIVDVWL